MGNNLKSQNDAKEAIKVNKKDIWSSITGTIKQYENICKISLSLVSQSKNHLGIEIIQDEEVISSQNSKLSPD